MERRIGKTKRRHYGYIGRCVRCNYVTWAIKLSGLKDSMGLHNQKSHNDYDHYLTNEFPAWQILRVSTELIQMLEEVSGNPKFWQAYRQNPKNLFVNAVVTP